MRLAITGITSGVGVRLAEKALARGDSVVGLVRSPSREDARALASKGAIYDASKAVRVLGWKPEVSARVGLGREAARRRR